VRACIKAGLRCVGVLTGGVGADELRAEGAVEVHQGPAALLRVLPDSALRRN
jgi:phosphoglycolate phosphatase-like HAD superfamily hydrolase